MKLKVALILITFVIALISTSCGGRTGEKIDVEKYREHMSELRKDNPDQTDKAKEARKSIFPKIKENGD